MFHNILLLKSSTNIVLSNITTHTTFILLRQEFIHPTQSCVIQLYKLFFFFLYFFFFLRNNQKIARAILKDGSRLLGLFRKGKTQSYNQ